LGALAEITNNGTIYLHPDHLGSAQAGTYGQGYSGSTHGNIAWREQYTPFGEEIVGTTPARSDLAGFTGHIKDSATGLNYMQARYYDPVIGRFLSVDPVGFVDTGVQGQFNRYSYTANNPINMTDPNGECPWCLEALISTGLEAVIIGVEVAAGKEVSAKEIAVRLGSSAVAGAAGVGILTKVKSVGKVAASLQKVTLPAGNGNAIKVGNALAGGFEGAVAGATSEVVGASLNQVFGVGDGASLQGTAVAAITGGLFGAITGGFSGDSIGEAINTGATPTVGNSVNAQAGIVESALGVLRATADGASGKYEKTCSDHEKGYGC
jgi:RHS repeat-associated protein